MRFDPKAFCTCAFAIVLGVPAPSSAQTLERHPYLQRVTPTSATIVWTTTASSDSVVRYGASPTSLTETATSAAGTQHEVKLTGLSPATRVYYAVGTTSATLAGGDAEHFVETAPQVGASAKFRAWIVGDSGTGAAPQAQVRDAMLAHAGRTRPKLFLHLGDMAYNSGTTAEFTSRFFAPYADVLRQTVVWPTLGNHEGANSDSASETGPYYTAYVLPRAGEAGGLPSGTEAYYAFDWGNVHFLVLDSHDSSRSPTGPMLTWAKADLEATQQAWIVAMWHHPPYTKGTHDSDTESQLIQMRENALPILEAGGVDLVLAGHSHIYERSHLVDGAYATPTTATGHIKDAKGGRVLESGPYSKPPGGVAHAGAVYVVAGHGGASLGGTANHPLMYVSEKSYGSCLLDVQGNRLAMLNVRADGTVSDRFTLVKGTGLVIGTPDGGESFVPGTSQTIAWATVGSIPSVDLAYSADDGATWTPIASGVANTGSYAWTTPSIDSGAVLVRVASAANPSDFDESNASFAIGGGPFTVVPTGSTWRYHDGADDPGAAWSATGFDDGAWPEGQAELGYGDSDEATVLADADPNVTTAYFRRRFTLERGVVEANVRVRHDDGFAVYVNGVLVASKHVDGLDHASFASAASVDNEETTTAIALEPSPFVEGENVIAVLVKQANATSSDLSFDLALDVTLEPPPPPPPSTTSTGAGGQAGATSGATTGASGGGVGGGTSAAGSGGADAGESGDGCMCRAGAPGEVGGLRIVALAALGTILGTRRVGRRRARAR